jgi:hypothetical protein
MANEVIPDNTLVLENDLYKHSGGTVSTTGATLTVKYQIGNSVKLYISALTKKKKSNTLSYVTESASDGKISIWQGYLDASTPTDKRFSVPVVYDKSDEELYWEITFDDGGTGKAWVSSYLDSKT